MRLMTVALMALAVLGSSRDVEAVRRRPTTCCIMVPNDDGTERPYCFILNVRPARYGRKACRLIGGRPQRPAVR